jgi:hypothetical protein
MLKLSMHLPGLAQGPKEYGSRSYVVYSSLAQALFRSTSNNAFLCAAWKPAFVQLSPCGQQSASICMRASKMQFLYGFRLVIVI